MIAALVEVAREHGAARVTVAHVVARSGVSRRTFYEMFEDRDACFMAALELAIDRGAGRVLPAFEQAEGADGVRGPGRLDDAADGSVAKGASRWHERVRAGLAALLEFLDDEPGLGGLCVVDTLSACPAALRRRAEIVRAFVDAVDAGRKEAKAGLAPTRLTAEGVVGGVLGVLYSRFAEQDPKPMLRLLNPLMAMIVLPYLGPAAAAKETARPAPRARPRSQRPVSNPLEGLDMRLTYRTVRVLAAIAVPREREQPPGRRSRRCAGPGPDLEAARASAAPRPDREHRLRAPPAASPTPGHSPPRPRGRARNPRTGRAGGRPVDG